MIVRSRHASLGKNAWGEPDETSAYAFSSDDDQIANMPSGSKAHVSPLEDGTLRDWLNHVRAIEQGDHDDLEGGDDRPAEEHGEVSQPAHDSAQAPQHNVGSEESGEDSEGSDDSDEDDAGEGSEEDDAEGAGEDDSENHGEHHRGSDEAEGAVEIEASGHDDEDEDWGEDDGEDDGEDGGGGDELAHGATSDCAHVVAAANADQIRWGDHRSKLPAAAGHDDDDAFEFRVSDGTEADEAGPGAHQLSSDLEEAGGSSDPDTHEADAHCPTGEGDEISVTQEDTSLFLA